MMTPPAALDREEFERLLGSAARGELLTDTGANDDIDRALEAVADEAPTPSIDTLNAARAAWRASVGDTRGA